LLVLILCMAVVSGADMPAIVETIDVAPVWAGHTVGFCLLTHGDRQFAAYYDAERRMTVAARSVGEKAWHTVVLPENVVWDSHNYITMTIDDDDYIHLSGNMHCVPLKYYRTEKPLDINTFASAAMVGEREDRATYPVFMRGNNNELIFTYRDGSSGNGDQIYNVYDLETKTWRRLLDEPLTSGQGKMNAYLNGPSKGSDGFWHLVWIWRDHGGCESNHDISYARSPDLVHWETSRGEALTLPITIENVDIVDPVPVKGGAINGNVKLGFDSQKRPVVSYHKYDEAGNTQIYNARCEDGTWKIYQTSDWTYRWDFSGGGAIPFELGLSGVSPRGEGTLKQSYSHSQYPSSTWLLDEATLKPVGTVKESRTALPSELKKITSDFPGITIRRANDRGRCDEANAWYVMQWETLGPNRDRPREGALPEPSMLRVYKLKHGN